MIKGIREAYSPDNANVVDLLTPGQGGGLSFRLEDFENAPNLVSKLKDEVDGPSAYLRDHFEDGTRRRLQSTHPDQPDAALMEALVSDLNRLLKDSSIDYEKVVKGIKLRAETEELLKQKPRSEEMTITLNRMLLEDAFPGAIRRADNIYFKPIFIPVEGKETLVRPADIFKRDIQLNLLRTYLDNMLLVRIPILGTAIHVNDLGLIGGLTLIVLLLMMRTSLSREIKNLNYSFKKATEANRLDEFYHALGMRQLFTIPHMRGEKRNRILSKAPYAVCLLPVLVYLSLAAYDGFTVYLYTRFNKDLLTKPIFETLMKPVASFVLWLVIIEGLCSLIIILLSLRCLERQNYIYYIWDSYWRLLPSISNYCLLEPGVAAHFQNGKEVNKVGIQGILEQIKESAGQPRKVNLVRRIWRAVKEEFSPIVHFLRPKKVAAAQPHLIMIDPDLAELFSNDKQINDTLRQFLKEREKNTTEGEADTI
ncbi:MAG: hypothetical protein JOZ96_12595 [Acidobacteria bacterium]|nr:hypothetical protein [Acidobacteriota bacterium]